MKNTYKLSTEEIKLLKIRESIADSNISKGLNWQEMKTLIKRKQEHCNL